MFIHGVRGYNDAATHNCIYRGGKFNSDLFVEQRRCAVTIANLYVLSYFYFKMIVMDMYPPSKNMPCALF